MPSFYAMTLYELTLLLHAFCGLVFGGFVLTDRLILRPALTPVPVTVYYRARRLLIPVAALLFLSGLWLLSIAATTLLIWKAILGGAALGLFFLCPIAMKRLPGATPRALYRHTVTTLLIGTLLLAFLPKA